MNAARSGHYVAMSADAIFRDEHGEFQRADATFRQRVEGEPERYHLYASPACPWSHRAIIMRELGGLTEHLSMSFVAPYRDERGWAFTGESYTGPDGRERGTFTDPINGWRFLSEAYAATDSGYEDHVSVPVLWDKQAGRIATNESADLVVLFDEWAGTGLYPESLRAEIDEINARVYSSLNNGVYRAGFAGSQRAYERAFDDVFSTLEWLDRLLAERRYLLGDELTIADWRLFPTLLRFDAVYYVHFRLNGRLIADHEHLWPYARDLFQQPGIPRTVYMDQIKEHYYTTHDELNPKRIIPKGPIDEVWLEPSER